MVRKYVPFLLFLISVFAADAQDTATVYFYRPEVTSVNSLFFKMYDGPRFIDWMLGQSALRYTCNPGKKTFVSKTKGGTKKLIEVSLFPGKTYFIRCSAVRYSPREVELIIEPEADAMAMIAKLTVKEIRNVNTRTPREDTVRAVENLFRRKWNSGRIRSYVSIFWLLQGLYGVLYATTSSSTSTVANGYTTTTAEPDSGLITVFLVESGVALIAAISGGVQESQYSKERMTGIVNAYNSGTPLPRIIKSKLKPKDFF